MNSLLDAKVKSTIQDGYVKFLTTLGLTSRISQKKMIASIASTLGSSGQGSRIAVIEAP